MTNDIELQAALRVAQTGLTPAELLALPLDEYARVTGRATPVQAALRALGAQQPPHAPQPAPEAPQPAGVEVNSDEFFHLWRAQRSSGGEGRGIFDSVGSQSQEYRDAAAKHAGRTAMAGREVHAAVPRVFVPEPERDQRSAAQRFSTPGNSYQG